MDNSHDSNEPVAWILKPTMELLWPDEIEVKDPSKHRGYKPLYTSPQLAPQQEPVSWERFMSVEKELQDMTAEFMRVAGELAALKAQQQEPWRNAALRVGEDLCSVGPFGYYDMTAEQWLDWALSVVTVHAPQPSKPWVSLTDEERREIGHPYFSSVNMSDVAYARAIEAKLREKNT